MLTLADKTARNAAIDNTCSQQRTVVNGFWPARQDCCSAAVTGAKEKQNAHF